MNRLIKRGAVLEIVCDNCDHASIAACEICKTVEKILDLPSADRPKGCWMPFEDIAQVMSNLFGECACDVNGNDEWLPQVCKYADTECPHPKEKNGCWMQFLMQGGADMRGGDDEVN